MKITIGGGSPIPMGECCCCQNCCHKFCGDESLQDNNDGGANLGILGDMTWYIEPASIQIELTENPDPPFCGVRFNFTVRADDGILFTECEGIPATMWLCSQDHRPSHPDCWCQCHWHIEIDECVGETQECNADGCLFQFDAATNEWVELRGCIGDCMCQQPEVAGGEQNGDIFASDCNAINFPEMWFWGGDGCLSANCDDPNCGDCGTFANAGINVLDPDYSVQCCCLGLPYDVGGV